MLRIIVFEMHGISHIDIDSQVLLDITRLLQYQFKASFGIYSHTQTHIAQIPIHRHGDQSVVVPVAREMLHYKEGIDSGTPMEHNNPAKLGPLEFRVIYRGSNLQVIMLGQCTGIGTLSHSPLGLQVDWQAKLFVVNKSILCLFLIASRVRFGQYFLFVLFFFVLFSCKNRY